MAATVVPKGYPKQSSIGFRKAQNPFVDLWWSGKTVSGVPENVMGWLVAQGWRITDVLPDLTTNPPTRTYTLKKQALSSEEVLRSLCNSYTVATNDARWVNSLRYNDIVTDWTAMIKSSEEHFGSQVKQQNADLGMYITDLGEYMEDIDNLSQANINDLKIEFGNHVSTARRLLIDLGIAEVARINEQATATLAVQLQKLVDDGLYTSAVAVDITERVHRDRDEQLQKHYDSLAREKLGNEHQLYAQRSGLSDHAHRAIVEQMNTAVARLEGWKSVAAENQRLMAYQLDTRNQLLIGLYSFVERRDDIAPEWKDMSQMIAGLADSAGGWITP